MIPNSAWSGLVTITSGADFGSSRSCRNRARARAAHRADRSIALCAFAESATLPDRDGIRDVVGSDPGRGGIGDVVGSDPGRGGIRDVVGSDPGDLTGPTSSSSTIAM